VTLERIEFGGARVSIAPTTEEIETALRSLSPPRDLVLLMRGVDDERAPYELSVTPLRKQVSICFTRGGVRRWLALGSDETPMADGDGLPSKLLVPHTWAWTVLDHAARTGEPVRTMPWHDARFVSLGPIVLEEVSFARCQGDRARGVKRMALLIEAHFSRSVDDERAADEVIAELRRVGHDLWSFDEERGIWCADYIRVVEGQGLTLVLGTKSVRVDFGAASATAP
jgi:hypothetical protein